MAAKRPHIMLGQGTKVTIGDLPIRDQLDRYLKRLRRTVPFPITPEEAYFGCMPAVIQRMYQDSLFEQGTSKQGRVSNLLLCLTTNKENNNDDQPNIAHVTVEGGDETFWFIAPSGCPTPVYRHGTQFDMPEDHPHRAALEQWVLSCLKIEDGIQRAFAAIAKLESNGPGPHGVAVGWPELLHFIKYKKVVPPMPTADARRFKERLDREISPIERLNTIELLTTCVMLPEKDTPLTAWVNFHMVGL